MENNFAMRTRRQCVQKLDAESTVLHPRNNGDAVLHSTSNGGKSGRKQVGFHSGKGENRALVRSPGSGNVCPSKKYETSMKGSSSNLGLIKTRIGIMLVLTLSLKLVAGRDEPSFFDLFKFKVDKAVEKSKDSVDKQMVAGQTTASEDAKDAQEAELLKTEGDNDVESWEQLGDWVEENEGKVKQFEIKDPEDNFVIVEHDLLTDEAKLAWFLSAEGSECINMEDTRRVDFENQFFSANWRQELENKLPEDGAWEIVSETDVEMVIRGDLEAAKTVLEELDVTSHVSPSPSAYDWMRTDPYVWGMIKQFDVNGDTDLTWDELQKIIRVTMDEEGASSFPEWAIYLLGGTALCCVIGALIYCCCKGYCNGCTSKL